MKAKNKVKVETVNKGKVEGVKSAGSKALNVAKTVGTYVGKAFLAAVAAEVACMGVQALKNDTLGVIEIADPTPVKVKKGVFKTETVKVNPFTGKVSPYTGSKQPVNKKAVKL